MSAINFKMFYERLESEPNFHAGWRMHRRLSFQHF